MSQAPLITVAMPVYNCENYLEEAVNSILTQTYSNFELIIIDDGSTDHSLKLLHVLASQDSRIRLVSRENRGISNTVNEIIEMAQGSFFALMHADDIALPFRLEKQLHWMRNNGADICGSWVKCFGTAGEWVLKHAQDDEALKLELLFGCAFANPTSMMRTEVVQSMRYDSAWDSAEDYEFWVRAACAGWRMTNIPEVLLLYRLHDGQISSASFSLQRELSQKIRNFYWHSRFKSLHLTSEEVAMVLSLRDPILPWINLDKLNLCFIKLLEQFSGESAFVLFDQITRLHYRIASTSLSVPFRWGILNRRFGNGIGLKTFHQLLFLAIFKISPSQNAFQRLKSLYLSIGLGR